MTDLPLPRARSAMEEGIANGLHLGAQLYASIDGRAIGDLAIGHDRPGEPLTRQHLMLWMSSTKPVAAVALAQLWELGELNLDDPIARFVPEFAGGGKAEVTLRHALTHTGGFRLLDVGWPRASWDEIIARISSARLEPRWVPGEKAGYHLTSSWFILGEVVQRIDGRPFDRYAREEIFEPLEMDDCWVGMPQASFEAYGHRIAVMYNTERGDTGEGLSPHSWHRDYHVVPCSPGGNGRGPMHQLGRFYEMLLGGGELHGRRLLRPQTVEALTAGHRIGMLDHTFQHILDWGLGFILNSNRYGADTVPYAYGPHASRRTYGHSGYRSSTAFADPARRLVVALAFNGTPSNDDHEKRIRAVLGALYEDLG